VSVVALSQLGWSHTTPCVVHAGGTCSRAASAGSTSTRRHQWPVSRFLKMVLLPGTIGVLLLRLLGWWK
jgi:hypothetical protein